MRQPRIEEDYGVKNRVTVEKQSAAFVLGVFDLSRVQLFLACKISALVQETEFALPVLGGI